MLTRMAASVCAVWFAACSSMPGAAPVPPIDVSPAEAAIIEADRDFNRSVAEGSRDRFAALIAPTAVFNGGTPDEARGRDAILESWAPFFEPGGPRLTWEPTTAHVLIGGDVGVTIGSWVRRTPGADGRTIERRGQYATTWVKQPDGRWLAAFDIGSSAP